MVVENNQALLVKNILQQAKIAQKTGKLPQALKLFRRVLNIETSCGYYSSYETIVSIFEIEISLNEPSAAVETANYLLASFPHLQKPYLFKARAELRTRDHVTALLALIVGLRYQPTNAAMLAELDKCRAKFRKQKAPLPPLETAIMETGLHDCYITYQSCRVVHSESQFLQDLPTTVIKQLEQLDPQSHGEKIDDQVLVIPRVVNFVTLASGQIPSMYSDGTYLSDIKRILSRAVSHLETIESEERKVVVFDIDDTALSGRESTLPMFDPTFLNDGTAPAIEPVLKFYQYLNLRRFKVIFLSERLEIGRTRVAQNLISAGFNEPNDRLILRGTTEILASISSFKASMRAKLVEEEYYHIVAVIGDQPSDFYGPYSGFHIKLPNYLYNIY